MKTTDFFAENNPTLFPIEMDVDISDLLHCAFQALEKDSGILMGIRKDLDAHALGKKAKRVADAEWRRQQNAPFGLDMPDNSKVTSGGSELTLGTGRPRMSEKAVYLFLILRGYFSSVTDRQACERIKDSRTVQAFFSNYGLGVLPARTTIHENVQAVTDGTKKRIFSLQLNMAKDEGFDDFREVTFDSTAVRANSCWPTDSGIIRDSLERAYRNSQLLNIRYGIPNLMPWHVPRWLRKIRSCHFKISVASGKGVQKKRRKLYRVLYENAEKTVTHLRRELEKHRSRHETAILIPSKAERLREILTSIGSDLTLVEEVIAYSKKRILDGKSTPSTEKVMSISDRSAAMIVKGDREPVVGYRPQTGRSRNGFVTVLHVPEGNANDAPQLHSLVNEVIRNTGTVPESISTDDGYSSTDGRNKVLSIVGVKNVSISCSKGKALTPVEDWESGVYEELRRNRSAVESLIFVLKYVYNFGRVRRRGIKAVRTELLEKAIVYNFMRIVELRKRRRKTGVIAA